MEHGIGHPRLNIDSVSSVEDTLRDIALWVVTLAWGQGVRASGGQVENFSPRGDD